MMPELLCTSPSYDVLVIGGVPTTIQISAPLNSQMVLMVNRNDIRRHV